MIFDAYFMPQAHALITPFLSYPSVILIYYLRRRILKFAGLKVSVKTWLMGTLLAHVNCEIFSVKYLCVCVCVLKKRMGRGRQMPWKEIIDQRGNDSKSPVVFCCINNPGRKLHFQGRVSTRSKMHLGNCLYREKPWP